MFIRKVNKCFWKKNLLTFWEILKEKKINEEKCDKCWLSHRILFSFVIEIVIIMTCEYFENQLDIISSDFFWGGGGTANGTVFITLEFWISKWEKNYCQIPFLTDTQNVQYFLQLCFGNGLLSNILL